MNARCCAWIAGDRLARAFSVAFVLSMLPMALAPNDVQAATCRWINPAGGTWTTGSNWDLGRAPGPADDAVLPDLGDVYSVTLNVQAFVRSVAIETDVRLRMGTDLSIHLIDCTGPFTNAGEIFDAGHRITATEIRNLATGRILVREGEELILATTSFVNDGIVTMGPAETDLATDRALVVSGSGEIVLSGLAALVKAYGTNGTLTQAAGHTIRGSSGEFSGNGIYLPFVNHGEVVAEGGRLAVGAFATTNYGVMRATQLSTLHIANLGVLGNAGLLAVEGGTISGRVANDGGRIEIHEGVLSVVVTSNQGGEIRQIGSYGTLQVGPVTGAGGAMVAEGELTLNGVTVTGGQMSGGGGVFRTSGNTLLKEVSFGANATLLIAGPTRVETSLHHDGDVLVTATLTAVNDVALSGSGSLILQGGSLGGPWHNPAGHLISGTGTIPGTLVNQGIVEAAGAAGQVLEIRSATNTGVLRAASAVLNLEGGAILNVSGTIEASGAPVWLGDLIRVEGGQIVSAGADILLLYSGSSIVGSALRSTGSFGVRNFGQSPLPGSQTPKSEGRWTDVVLEPGVEVVNEGVLLVGGASLTNHGALRSSGTVRLAPGTTLQGGGEIVLLPGGRLESVAAIANPAGHAIRGEGTIAATFVNQGLLAPGASPGVIRVEGDFQQTASGRLEIELAGTGSGEFDRLEVTGAATLDGTFALALAGGYAPAEGDAFAVIPYGSRSGDFATYEGMALPGGGQALAYFAGNALNVRIEQQGVLPVIGRPLPQAIRFYAPGSRGEDLVLELPEAAEVAWGVFDVGGRRIAGATVPLAAGVHRLDAGARGSGVYFARAIVSASGKTVTRGARLVVAR